MPDRPVVLWRAYVPRWSFRPLSGEGAARFGGRWNPVGAPTVYAERELSTAWAEYNQGFVQHPALIARLELADATLVNLTEASELARLGVDSSIHACEWRRMMDERQEPPTHVLRRRLLAGGADGIVYPSFMSPGGSCVALWRWNRRGAPRLKVVDPEGRMPKSAASWV